MFSFRIEITYIAVFLSLIFTVHCHAQDVISSNTSVENCLNQTRCSTVNNASYLFYDETRNEFYLKVDFTHFRSETDSANIWIDDMLDSTIYFKGILPKESFPSQNIQSTKSFKMNGEIFYNDIVEEEDVEISIYSTENGIVQSGSGNLKYDAYKVNFSLPIVAEDYKVYKKAKYKNQTISINVTLGRINLLRPGMEFYLKEVYFKSTR